MLGGTGGQAGRSAGWCTKEKEELHQQPARQEESPRLFVCYRLRAVCCTSYQFFPKSKM